MSLTQTGPTTVLNWDNGATREYGRPRRVLETPPGHGRSAKEIDMDERTCTIEGCVNSARTRGWCNAHYLKWYRTGDPEYRPPVREVPECSVEGCSRSVRSRGWCNAHYQRWYHKTDLGRAAIRRYRNEKGPCSFTGCVKPSRTDGICEGHAKQRKLGRELTPLQRRTDPTARDEHGNKFCGTCDSWLPVASFARSAYRADGLSARCDRCRSSAALKRKFGITLEQYEQLLAAQGGACSVCGKTEKANRRRLAVDHDHSCCPGQVTCGKCLRGLLCSSCNLHFGAIGDSLAHIEAMATYLRATQIGRR